MAVDGSAPGPGLTQQRFTELFKDIPVHFQVLDLPKQTFVWVACGSARLVTLSAAALVPQTGEPAVTSLLGWSATSAEQGLASRLAKASGKAVLLSLNLPQQAVGMESFIEVELKKHLVRQ